MQTLLALSSAGLILAVLANVEPLLTFDVAGNEQSNVIGTGVVGLIDQGYWPVAALVFFGVMAAPVLHLAAVFYVASACCLRRRWRGVARVVAAVDDLAPWNLALVYFVAVVVSVMRLDLIGKVAWGPGTGWILALGICSLLTAKAFDRMTVEEWVARLQ